MSMNLSLAGRIRDLSLTAVVVMIAAFFISSALPGELSAADTGARQAYSVDVSGDIAVVGASWEDGYSGAAYVLRKDGDSWVVEQRLVPSDLGQFDHFGGTVSIDGDRIIVTSPWHDLQRGATYEFRLDGGQWVEDRKIPAPRDAVAGKLAANMLLSSGPPEQDVLPADADVLINILESETGSPPPLMAPAALEAPEAVSATDSTMEDRVKITWENTGQDAIAYKVLRDDDLVSLISSDGSFYDDMNGDPGETYEYCVVVTDMAAEETTPVCDDGTRIIFAPHNVEASDGKFNDEVIITWGDISTINTGYNIYRDDVMIGTAGPNEYGFSDTDVDTINVHSYDVAAFVPGGFESARIGDDGWRGIILPPLDVSASDGQYLDRVEITWQDPDTIEAGYWIYRDSDLIDSTGVDGESFMDSTVVFGETYTYCVTTRDSTGNESVWICDEGGTGLTPPGSVSASDSTFDDRVRVTWEDLSDFEDGYEITRVELETPPDPDPPAPFVKDTTRKIIQAQADLVILGSAGEDVTSYDDFTAEAGIAYTYSVRAVSDEGGASTEVTDDGYRSVVLAPYDVLATDGTFEDYADITWNSISTTTSMFKILRDGLFIKTVSGGDRSYRDYGGTAGQDYEYSVIAITALGVEAVGPTAFGKRELLAPSGLTASDEGYEDKTVISWRDYSRIEQGYLVMRRDTASAVVDSFVIGPNRSSYTDYTAPSGVTFMYSVSAFDSLNGMLGYSVPGEDIGRRVLLAPTDVSVDTGISETMVEITWRDNSGAEDGYRIYRDNIEILPPALDNATSYVDSFTVFGQNHVYRVHAYDAYGESTGDSSSVITTLAAPMSFNASDVYTDRVEMTWVNQSDIADGYKVYRGGELIQTISQLDLTSYTDIRSMTGSVYPTTRSYGVAISGNYAYVADYSSGLRVIDVNNAATPVQVGIYNTPGNARKVVIDGIYAYVADETSLQILDISSPTPTFVGSYPATNALDVAVAGDHVYVANGSAYNMLIINVTDRANPTLAGTFNPFNPYTALVVDVSDGYAYLGMSSGADVRIVDVSDPTAPVESAKIDSWNNYGLVVDDGYAYLGKIGSTGMEIWDVHNPLAPTQEGIFPGSVYTIAVAGDTAYVGDSSLGLQVVDISDRKNPRLVSSYSVGGIRGIAVSGGYVYAASWNADFHIIAPPELSLGTDYSYCVRAYKGVTLSERACDEGVVSSVYAGDARVSELYLKLLASDGEAGDLFGTSVSISGDRAIIGARDDDDDGANAGAAYIFERNTAGEWEQKTKLYASNSDAGDIFGNSVAIQGDLAIIGAPGDNSGQGSIYTFERGAGGTWAETHRYVAEYPDADDNFGYSVAISGDRAIIGSYKYNDSAAEAGAAYIILRGPTGSWSREATLLADDPTAEAWFGYSVAISGDRAIVGARNKTYPGAGAVYIFEADGSTWTQEAKAAGASYYMLGHSVAISGDWACAGSPSYCDYGAGGAGTEAGAVYLFKRDAEGAWPEVRKILASDAVGTDYFGRSVAMMDDRLVVGVNGSDDRGNESGAAYVFRLSEEGTWKQMEKAVAVDGTADDGLGYSVALDGEYAIIAARNDDDQATGAGSVYIAGVKDVYNVTATDGTLKSRVSITWDDRSYNETGFRIYRDEDKIIDLAPNTEIYEDFDAEPGRTYEYSVVPLIGALSEEGYPVSDFGWHPANGNITGSIATIRGAAVDSVWIEVTPPHTKALLFDGSGGYVEISDSAGTFDFGAENSFTIEAWVKYPGDGGAGAGDAMMITKALPGSVAGRFPFSLGNMRSTGWPGRLSFTMSDGTTQVSAETARFDIHDNAWHHVACVHDAAGDSISIYVDGILEGGRSYAGIGDITNAEPLTLGTGFATGSSFNGQLDEVRIWSVARSDSLIAAAMAKPLEGTETDLIAYWPIGWPSGYRDEESRGVITDLTEDAHYGVFQDGVYWTDNCAELDIYSITDELGNYVVKGLYYGTEDELEVRPFAINREFEPAVKRVVLTTDSPVENQVDFVDISTYLVTGVVRYENTDCASADISLYVDGDPGGTTDTKGKFSMELERGEHWIRPTMEGHTFEPESLFVDSKLDGVAFDDLTVRTLSGGLGGGCGRLIGDISITVISENGCLLRNYEYLSIDSVFTFSVDLPPQNYLVSANVDVMSIAEGLSKTDVVRFFQNLGSRMAEMDSVDVEMDFVYRAPLMVEIKGFAEYLEYLDECPGPLVFGERVLPENLPVIPQLSEVMCSIQVYEDYGAGGLCPLDSGSVVIYDELFDELNNPVELEVRDGLVVYPTIAIAPSLIIGRTDEFGIDRSFQRSITAVVNVEGRDPVSAAQWALVTGHLAPEGADFVTGTTEIPMYILRDPPGDQSYAFLEEGHSLRTRIDWDNNLHVLQGGLNIRLWRGFKIGWWKFKISFKATAETDWMLGKEWSDENYTDYTVTTKKTFSTSGGDGAIGAEGDVFVGMGHNFIFSEVGVVDVDFDNCEVEKTVSVGFEPDSVATVYSYTQQYIEETLIPELYAKVDYYEDDGDLLTSTYFRVKAEYWTGLLQENEDLKRLASTLQNRSFSAGADYTYFQEESTSETYTRTSKFVLDGSLKVGLEVGSRVGGAVTVQGQWHHENLLSYTDTTGTETQAIGYTFSDDDAGDHFTVDIKDDGRYPTPVFDVPAGVSSCPYEPWADLETGDARMMPRDKPALNIAPLELSGVPQDEPAVFTLNLANLSPTDESRLYVLRTLNTSNPYGAILKVGDVPIANGLSYLIETSQSQQATLTVERGPTRYNYEDLAVVLYPPCEAGEWEQSGALADTIYFDVSFDAPCSDLTMLLPENGWVYDKEDQDSTTGILLLLTDYELQISETDTMQSVWGQYRRLGVDSEGPTEWQDMPAADSLGTAETVLIWYPPENLEDGVYEIRAYTKCAGGRGYSETATGTIERYGPMVFGTPEPADGELSFGDDISITFNKLIDCWSVHTDTLLLHPDRLSLSYVDWPDSGATIALETACNGQTVVITPTVPGTALEGRRLQASVSGVTDAAGNPIVSPVTWEFDYRKSKFAWSELHLTEDVPYRNPGSVTAELVNGTDEPAEFTIAAWPSWIESVSPAAGTIPPSGTQTVTFTLQDYLEWDGDYADEIRATAGEDVALFDLNVMVSCHEPEWMIDPGDFEHSMTMVAQLHIGTGLSIDPNDMVAAVVGNELRGVAPLQQVTTSHLAFLTIYSNRATGETVRFQVWDADSCKLYNGTDMSFPFIANDTHGNVGSPITLTATEIEGSDSLTVAANRGWTWISTNVKSTDMSVTSILADLNLASGDLIKSQSEFSQFVEYAYPDSVPTWVPPFELDNVYGYMVNLAQAGTIRHSGTMVVVDTTFIPVKQGWNWIGYLPNGAVSLNTALSDLEAGDLVATGDIIKSQYAFAEYVDPDWYGSLTEMEPGKGYKLLLASDVDSSFAYPPGPYTVPPPALASAGAVPGAAEAAENAPTWSVDPHGYQFNMTVTAVLRVDDLESADGRDVIGAFVGDECRGVTQPVYVTGLKRYEAFLMIYSNEAAGETVEFRVFDADAGVVCGVSEKVDCAADVVLGTVTQPFVLSAVSGEEEEDGSVPKAYALGQNVPNPFNPSTTVYYDVPSGGGNVSLRVYDVSGRLVRTLVDGHQAEGSKTVTWDGTGDRGQSVASGIYFYRMSAPDFTQTKKMVLLR